MKNLLILSIAAIGLSGIFGWMLQIPSFISVLPNAVTMKPITALMFCLSAFIMACLSETKPLTIKIEASLLLVSSWMLSFCYLMFAGGHFIPVSDVSVYSLYPGVPSVVTSLCFTLISGIGFVRAFLGRICNPKCCGYLLSLIGLVALGGHVLGIPWMFYYKVGISAGMAINTAFGFILIGVFIWLLKK